MPPVRSVAIVSQKGGVGKTTVALNLAFSLARRGSKICVVDLDPQGAIGLSLTRRMAQQPGVNDWLTQRTDPGSLLVQTRLPALTLLPAGSVSGLHTRRFQDDLEDGARLSELLRALGGFDVVLVDTPSGFVGATLGAMRACERSLIPVQAEPIAARTLMRTFQTLKELKASGRGGEVLGLVLSMLQRDDPSSSAIAEDVLRTVPKSYLFDTVIPRAPAILEASAAGVPLGLLAKRPPAAASIFDALAAEVEARLNLRGEEPEDAPIALVD